MLISQHAHGATLHLHKYCQLFDGHDYTIKCSHLDSFIMVIFNYLNTYLCQQCTLFLAAIQKARISQYLENGEWGVCLMFRSGRGEFDPEEILSRDQILRYCIT